MVEIGVLNSCVMLLMKSFFISVSRFWRTMSHTVKQKVMNSTMVNTSTGIILLATPRI